LIKLGATAANGVKNGHLIYRRKTDKGRVRLLVKRDLKEIIEKAGK
jgi:hypothetical protein